MVDFKGNELGIGDKVVFVDGYGYKYLREGYVTRLTKAKAAVSEKKDGVGGLKESRHIFKIC